MVIFQNEFLILSKPQQSELLTVTVAGSSAEYTLAMPTIEVNHIILSSKDFSIKQIIEHRKLLNGGTEYHIYCKCTVNSSVCLTAVLRVFPKSPFFRIRYILNGNGAKLTKTNHEEHFVYSRLQLSSLSKLSEVQISQFEENAHAYLPHIEDRSETFHTDTFELTGPILLAEDKDNSVILAYEHGSEYPDTYLNFKTVHTTEGLAVLLKAVNGTYFDGEYFDDKKPYYTAWYHYGFCKGDTTELLRHYRNFFLKYISENAESRKPYIFYNTWNNQERNRAFRNKKYLDNMNLSQMLQEIEVAHKMGVDVFVIDTAWYLSTGDWDVDLARYPDGLQQIKNKLTEYDMKFGLWFNPTAAAISSKINTEHHEYCKNKDGVDEFLGSVWETEDSFGMCLVSEYTDWYIQNLIELSHKLGVTYFKWDAVGMHGCDSPNHNHGTSENPKEEREKCFGFKSGLALTRIVEEVSREIPDAIFDFDITEGGRYVGLGFLSVGKFFHINNGPYYHNFDIPNAREIYEKNVNVFFYPGVSRDKVCRQFTKYDSIIPSILFLTHFLPDKPLYSQKSTLASLVLGGNGIWGDLLSLDDNDIMLFHDTLTAYKKVSENVTNAYPIVKGFIGTSPEIHEKIDYENAAGIVVFFTKQAGVFTHITEKINVQKFKEVIGADEWELSRDGYLKITVNLEQNDSRIVFINSCESI